jgi:hypothetical protein
MSDTNDYSNKLQTSIMNGDLQTFLELIKQENINIDFFNLALSFNHKNILAYFLSDLIFLELNPDINTLKICLTSKNKIFFEILIQQIKPDLNLLETAIVIYNKDNNEFFINLILQHIIPDIIFLNRLFETYDIEQINIDLIKKIIEKMNLEDKNNLNEKALLYLNNNDLI